MIRTGSRAADIGLASVEAGFGAWLSYLSWGPLHHLFGGYMDNAPVVYVALGLFFLVPGIALIWLAVRLAFVPGGPPDRIDDADGS